MTKFSMETLLDVVERHLKDQPVRYVLVVVDPQETNDRRLATHIGANTDDQELIVHMLECGQKMLDDEGVMGHA